MPYRTYSELCSESAVKSGLGIELWAAPLKVKGTLILCASTIIVSFFSTDEKKRRLSESSFYVMSVDPLCAIFS
jgi:hypothetical protein